jgi:pyridinium-3,5-biscarboxylic acid mononucleotide sulfurtransferase
MVFSGVEIMIDTHLTQPEEIKLSAELQNKYTQLRALLASLGSVLVAYSGGVDSALLLKVASDMLGNRCQGVLAISPAYDDEETAAAINVATTMGIAIITVRTDEINNPAYIANDINRCFHCKEELFTNLEPIARSHKLAHIVYGINLSDMGDFRPGQRSARQRGVKGPLLDAGFEKADIRALAHYLQVPVWNKPAQACYSSRIPYGTPVTAETLQKITRAERLIRALGFKRVRVRHHDQIARIEVDTEEIMSIVQPDIRIQIDQGLREIGYLYITLDLRGYRTGSMNEVLRHRNAAKDDIIIEKV